MITFDDAYSDITEYALPALRRSGFAAGVYVVTGQVGGTNAWDEARGSGAHRLMSEEQIREWADQGIEFGVHSHTHPDLTILSGTALEREVIEGAGELERIVDRPVVSFAYPYGAHNAAVRACARRRFALAFTTEEGLNDAQTERQRLRRTMVYPTDSPIDLACRVRFGWGPVQRLRYLVGLRSRFAYLRSLSRR